MKRVTLKAVIDSERCVGCKICEKVCPVVAITVFDRCAHVKELDCRGCANCADRCPKKAVKMVKREQAFDIGVDVSKFDQAEIRRICERAHLNPEQILCYCVGTRAEEVAAALLSGASTPEEVSAMTGIRTGCTIECIQPLLRMVEAAGFTLHADPNGWRWYGKTVTARELPKEVKEKYNSRGFYFDEDRELLDQIVKKHTGCQSKGGKDHE